MDNTDVKQDDVVETDDVVQTPEYTEAEQSAMAKGWKPKDKWIEEGGSEEDWKPAKVFNEIGALKDQLTNTEKEVKKLNKITAIMKEHHLNVRDAAYKQAMTDLKAQRHKALEAEDFVKAEKIKDQMDEVRDRYDNSNDLPPEVEEVVQQANQTPDPAFTEFLERNPWYKPNTNDEMTKHADALGLAYASADRTLTFKEVITKVEKDMRKLYPEKFDTPRNPVNDGTNRTGATGKNTSKVKLSEEELAVAKAFGLTPEKYAKELEGYKGR